MSKIEGRNYFVNFEMHSTIINAFITFKESVTNNEVYAICSPNCITVKSIKIDGINYEVDFNFDREDDFINTNTNRKVGKKKCEYLKSIANHIIAEGNEYLRNTFGNIQKQVLEII